MSLRWLLAIVGLAAAIGAGVALLIPVHIDSMDMYGNDISCGIAFRSDTKAAWMKDHQAVLAGGSNPGNVDACESALSTRKMWALPLAIVGGVVLLGALVVRSPVPQREARGGENQDEGR